MTVNSFESLLWFGALYCATQGALDSWDEAYELSYLQAYEVSDLNIALAQTLGVIPMAIKGVLSVPSDLARVRRPFLAAGLILSGCMFLIKTTFNPLTSFWAYCLCLMLRNAGAAVSDGAADGLTIDADVEALSGTLSAWQGLGRMAGLILSTAIGGALAGDGTYAGYRACLLFLGAWMLCSAPVVGVVKEELTPSPWGAKLQAGIAWASHTFTCGMDVVIARLWSTHVSPVLLAWWAKGSTTVTTAVKAGVAAVLTAVGLRSASPRRKVGEEVVGNPLAVNASATAAAASGPAAPGGPGACTQGGQGAGPASPGPTEAAEAARRARMSRLVGAPAAAPATEPDGHSVQHVHSPLMIGIPQQGQGQGQGGQGQGQVADTPTPTALATPTSPSGSGSGGASPTEGEAMATSEAYRLLLKHVQRTPVAAFVAFMFVAQLATYIASFPVVLWLRKVHNFSVADVGYITVVGAFGNAAGCFVAGYAFDWIPIKRLALLVAGLLSGLPYILFLYIKGQPAVYTVWTLISVGYGSLYTVQVSQMRLLADKRVAAAYAGLCMGMLAAAAAVGTYTGGLLSEYTTGYDSCYIGGAVTSVIGVLLVPWITSEDPEMVEMKLRQRAEKKEKEWRKARRRSSFGRWVAKVRGQDAAQQLMEEEAAATALLQAKQQQQAAEAGAGGQAQSQVQGQAGADGDSDGTARPTLRRPALGSMRNLLDARDGDEEGGMASRVRRAVRSAFDDTKPNSLVSKGKGMVRRMSRSLSFGARDKNGPASPLIHSNTGSTPLIYPLPDPSPIPSYMGMGSGPHGGPGDSPLVTLALDGDLSAIDLTVPLVGGHGAEAGMAEPRGYAAGAEDDDVAVVDLGMDFDQAMPQQQRIA